MVVYLTTPDAFLSGNPARSGEGETEVKAGYVLRNEDPRDDRMKAFVPSTVTTPITMLSCDLYFVTPRY